MNPLSAILPLAVLTAAPAQASPRAEDALAAAVTRAWTGDVAPLAGKLDAQFKAGEAVSGTLPGYLGSYRAVAQAFDRLRVTTTRLRRDGDRVELVQTLTGRRTGHLGGAAPTRRLQTFTMAQTFTLAGDRVVAAAITTDLLKDVPAPRFAAPPQATAIAPVEIVATFPPGSFPEGMVVRPDGSIVVSMLFDNRLFVVRPGGAPEVLATLPFAAGLAMQQGLFCIVRAPDGTLYATVAGGPEVGGVWAVPENGPARRIAALPPGVIPNGITRAPDGTLYVADTFGGAIWQVDPATGAATPWLDAAILKPRPFVGQFPGVNGVQTDGRHVWATLSDTALLVRIPITPDGRAGTPVVVSDRLAGDDFVIAGRDLIVTTHPFNTVERLAPDGRRTLLAGVAQEVIGPVTAALADAGTVYVATDGGLYAPLPDRPPVSRLVRIVLP